MAKPWLSRTARRIRKSPTACGTRMPAAKVWASAQRGACSTPSSQALTIGAQPAACTATMRGRLLLEQMGWISSKRPRMVAVQAAGCAPMVKAWEDGVEHAPRWADAHTFAAGIRVPQAVGDFLILRAVRESQGFAIAVDDSAIADAWSEVARDEGLLLCPEGAATFAAYRQ